MKSLDLFQSKKKAKEKAAFMKFFKKTERSVDEVSTFCTVSPRNLDSICIGSDQIEIRIE